MRSAALLTAVAVALGGCALAPRYQAPVVATPAGYNTADWQPAVPADTVPRGEWWRIYRDPDLDALQHRLLAANPDLGVAAARYAEARALATEASAGLFPTVGTGALATRDRQSDNRPLRSASQPAYYRDYAATAGASYELDLWGRVRSAATIGRATAEAAAADLESVRLSLTAELAGDYLSLCGLDVEGRLLADTVTAYRHALELAKARHEGGIASGLDEARAAAQLDDAAAQLTDVTARRQLLVHAIARLVGAPASGFEITTRQALPAVPNTPAGVPASLAQRRPDVAAAERRTAAANAGIGVARAAYFPRLTLTGLGGYESTGTGNWISAPNQLWAVGPAAALTLFDAGARRAEVARARSALDEAGQRYRAIVLAAFQEVEDSLSLLSLLQQETAQQEAAATAAGRALQLANNRYDEGAVSYLDVVVSQATSLQADRGLLAVRVRRLLASVALVRGLGGGWDEPARK